MPNLPIESLLKDLFWLLICYNTILLSIDSSWGYLFQLLSIHSNLYDRHTDLKHPRNGCRDKILAGGKDISCLFCRYQGKPRHWNDNKSVVALIMYDYGEGRWIYYIKAEPVKWIRAESGSLLTGVIWSGMLRCPLLPAYWGSDGWCSCAGRLFGRTAGSLRWFPWWRSWPWGDSTAGFPFHSGCFRIFQQVMCRIRHRYSPLSDRGLSSSGVHSHRGNYWILGNF